MNEYLTGPPPMPDATALVSNITIPIRGFLARLSSFRDEIVFGTAVAIKLGVMALSALGTGASAAHVMAPVHIVRTFNVAPQPPIAPLPMGRIYRPVAFSGEERQFIVRTVSRDGRVMILRLKT